MILAEAEFVDLPTPTGPMRTYLFRPLAGGTYPALVLYSEIFQMTGPIRRTAAWLAGHGFLVAVPEVYHEDEPPGTILAYDVAGADRGNFLKKNKPVEAFDSDTRSVLEYLVSHPHSTGQLGVMGMCLGGHLAFRAAMHPGVKAAACFYPTDIHSGTLGKGGKDGSLARVGEIQGELLMVFGRQDPHIPIEGRLQIHSALEAADRDFQWIEVNAAHAFLRDEGPRYNPMLAAQCLGWAVDLFRRRLGGHVQSPGAA